MMKIHIYMAQKKLLPFCKDAVEEYVKRLGRYAKVKLYFPEEKKAPVAPQAEGYTLILSPEGQSISSEDLADHIREWAVQGRSNLRIFIGWPQAQGDWHIKLTEGNCSLSMETVLMTEQLYRSFRIIHGEPYHK